MEDWQKRVVEERDQLKEKIDKLEKFLDAPNSLDAYNTSTLTEQKKHMVNYYVVLNARIGLFTQL